MPDLAPSREVAQPVTDRRRLAAVAGLLHGAEVALNLPPGRDGYPLIDRIEDCLVAAQRTRIDVNLYARLWALRALVGRVAKQAASAG